VKPHSTGSDKKQRVFRGGSWGNDPSGLSGVLRNRVAQSRRFAFIGFRLVLDVPKEKR